MNKFFSKKKCLLIFLGLLFLIIAIPVIVFAAFGNPFYQSSSNSSVSDISATNQLISIYNLSATSYFVPNNTAPEWTAFKNNSPKYVAVSVCGDGACTQGESRVNCSSDCQPANPYEAVWCGDGVCQSGGVSGERYSQFNPETTTNCPEDCGLSYLDATCQACGYAGNGAYCSNQCSGDGDPHNVDNYNCVAWVNPGERNSNRFYSSCKTDISGVLTLTPAGSYNKYGIARYGNITTCPAGYYCVIGSYKPRICPPNTYSSTGASSCTACPANKESNPGSTSSSACAYIQYCGDNICDAFLGETPRNCPQDCPSADMIGSLAVNPIGDGLCTGNETISNSPSDCHCGDRSCNDSETTSSCLTDCHCGNGICENLELYPDSTQYSGMSPTDTAMTIGYRYCHQDCSNQSDDICASFYGETSSNSPSDCHCGNGTCEPAKGENFTNCYIDCHCGNGVCESDQGETLSTCSTDCTCGNGVCNLTKEENHTNCSDCRCGDGYCDSAETWYSNAPAPYYCFTDCHCGDFICQGQAPYNEIFSNCSFDCGYCGDGVCGFMNHNKEDVSNCSSDCH